MLNNEEDPPKGALSAIEGIGVAVLLSLPLWAIIYALITSHHVSTVLACIGAGLVSLLGARFLSELRIEAVESASPGSPRE